MVILRQMNGFRRSEWFHDSVNQTKDRLHRFETIEYSVFTDCNCSPEMNKSKSVKDNDVTRFDKENMIPYSFKPVLIISKI